ncbi:cytoskeleton-associated protein 2-like [Leptodactylus fuscus]|uniref:cytoskeleton-associated protein 2-like n=1 Tax=Leptodactylus fuscus TaxID=238119 RepID=UPI003F4E94C7
MESKKRQRAEEERRLKLLEYLSAKGKLKPQTDCKPYLKDRTNVQNKKPQVSSKPIFETKKNAPNKGSHFASESNKIKTSNTGPWKSSLGKIPTQKTVPVNRPGNKNGSRNPLPLKCSQPKVRPDLAGRTLHPPSVISCHAKKQERREESDITLTVVLTKKQHGEKPEIRVVDPTSSTTKGQQAPGPLTGMATSREHKKPVTKIVTQSTKSKSSHHDYRDQPPAGHPMPTASGGHIRIVSRLSSGAKTANERSFLIKSSRTDGSRQSLNVQKELSEGQSQKMTCPARHSSAALVSSSTNMVHKKISMGPVTGPVPAPQKRPYSLSTMSTGQNIHSLNKQTAPRRSTASTGCNKVADRLKDDNNTKNRVTEAKRPGMTGGTKETITKPATDATSRPQTPRMTAEDRKKKLQEWLNSKGKTYKRPPMMLPPKRPPTAKKQNPCNRSLWEGIEEEEELLCLSKKINQTLSECLELIEKGIPGEDIHAALDNVPEGKKFAKYWVCKARLLEREGVYDVVDLYKQGVQFGATPIDELRDIVFDIMKNMNKKTKVVTFGPLPAEELKENDSHEDVPVTPFTNRTEEVKTPCTGTGLCDQGSAVKLQITSLSSKKKVPGSGQEWKRLTPVRRSVRIHHSAAQYPEVVQEHDTVVSSLDELLDQADTDAFLYMRNEALPEEADHNVISLMEKDPPEGEQEGPA